MRNIDFYLDAFELIDKPKRVFMGLRMQVEQDKDHSGKEKELVIKIIEKAEADFYERTLPGFVGEIRLLD